LLWSQAAPLILFGWPDVAAESAGAVTFNRVGKAVQIFVFDLVVPPPAMMIPGSLHARVRGEKCQSTTRPCNTASFSSTMTLIRAFCPKCAP
jgi:hypothetical protein